MKRVLIGALLSSLVLLGVSLFAPLSSEFVRIVFLRDSSGSITLNSGQHLKQRVHLSMGTYSGVVVFSQIPLLEGRNIRATILDTKGNIIAKGSANRISYRAAGDAMEIEIPVSWFKVDHDAFFTMDLELVHGDSIPLRVMERESNLPAVHKLSIDTVSQNAILSLYVTKRVPTAFGLQQGMIIGVAFLLAVALVSTIANARKKYWAAVALIIVFAPLAVMGYWFSTGDLGISDWDFYFTLHDSYRKAVLEYHTFPFWNPYICGGTAGLADPEFPFFSPTFLLEFIFGIPVGIRLAITLSVIVGATGMLTLARSLGRSVEAGLIAALAVGFGTVSLVEITEGHVNVLAAMWIPWILWSWLRMYRGKGAPIVCAFFLALTFLGGGIYLLMYTTFAFITLILLVRQHRRALWLTVQSGLWALGLVSFKLIPVLLWLKQFPDDAYASSSYTLPWLTEILFGRHLHGAYIISGQATGWHEYGAYIGYVVGALALIGISRIRKNRIIQSLLAVSVITLVVSAMGPALQAVFDPLWFFPRSNISRLILFSVIPLSLLAAYGADNIAAVFKGGKAARALLVGIVAIDIISLTYQLSEQAFVLPHVVPQVSPAPSPIAFNPNRYDDLGEGSRHTRSYEAYKAGYGTLVYCSVLGPHPAVRTIYDEGSNGAASVTDSRANVSIASWNYNRVRVHVETPVETNVVLNTNYVEGWVVNNEPAIIESNRVAAHVQPGTHDLEFVYTAPGFRVGAVLSLLTVVALVVVLRKKK